jgi:hypothetical protein
MFNVLQMDRVVKNNSFVNGHIKRLELEESYTEIGSHRNIN